MSRDMLWRQGIVSDLIGPIWLLGALQCCAKGQQLQCQRSHTKHACMVTACTKDMSARMICQTNPYCPWC